MNFQDAYDCYTPVLENHIYSIAENMDYMPDRFAGFRLPSMISWIGTEKILAVNSVGLQCEEIQ